MAYMPTMKERSAKKEQVSPQAEVLNRLLSLARLIRRQGTPEMADEALEWEKQIMRRKADIEQTVAA
jgi:hypothetical protein